MCNFALTIISEIEIVRFLYIDYFHRASEKTDDSCSIVDMDCKEASLGCRICDFSTTNANTWAMHFDIQEPSKSACIIGLEMKR